MTQTSRSSAPNLSGSLFTGGTEQQWVVCGIKRYSMLIALCFVSHGAFGQTTRTNPSASSTSSTIPFSSSTSPNAPCVSSNPTSPCYASKAPRNPCYSAVAPNEPCTTTTAPPNFQDSSNPSRSSVKSTPSAIVHAFTRDQARAQIETKGYANVSALQRDAEGNWHGRAEKDGSLWNVTLDGNGNVTAK
jgi:hypothetical protein